MAQPLRVTDMNETRASFDWMAFLVRVVAVMAGATWFLIHRLRRHDGSGIVLVVVIGYVILPGLAYLHTRYYNLKFMVWLVEAVKRKIVGARHDRSLR